MSIKNEINEKLKEAMKSGDNDAKRVYRMALSSIKFCEKENQKDLSDEEALQIIQKELKIRRESLDEAVKAGREESIEEAKKDIANLEVFLPKQLSSDELKKIVKETIEETGANNAADMGKVMKSVMPKVKGLAANADVSKAVKELLS